MKQDEIIEMAKEARLFYGDKLTEDYAYKVKRFAKLVAAKEREACAKLVADPYFGEQGKECAESIRARGEA